MFEHYRLSREGDGQRKIERKCGKSIKHSSMEHTSMDKFAQDLDQTWTTSKNDKINKNEYQILNVE